MVLALVVSCRHRHSAPPRDLEDPRSGIERRHYVHEVSVQRAVRAAAQKVGLSKRATRTCSGTPLPRICSSGAKIYAPFRVARPQERRHHANIHHVMNRPGLNLRSPLD
jgi:hypothetical protein